MFSVVILSDIGIHKHTCMNAKQEPRESCTPITTLIKPWCHHHIDGEHRSW